jgi:hypothetical protein
VSAAALREKPAIVVPTSSIVRSVLQLLRDGSQFTGMLFHPRIDGGIPLDSAVESQQSRRLHRFLIYHQSASQGASLS